MQSSKDSCAVRRQARALVRALGLSLIALIFLAFVAASALAGQTHVAKTTFGTFAKPSGIAIDQANGNVFVADGDSPGSVEIFGPEGGAPTGVTTTKIEGFDFRNGPPGLAIDESATSPSKGALYVTDVEHNTVKKFVLEAGKYEEKGTLNATPPAPPLVRPRGVAVDAKGNVFVANEGNGQASIVVFTPTGSEIIGGRIETQETVGRPSALAFDSVGNLFVQSFGGLGVWEFQANASGEIEPSTQPVQITTGSPTGIAVDQSNGTLYVAEKTHVDQYSTSCTPVNDQCAPELQFGFGILGETQRLAVAPSGDIDVVDRANHHVVVFAAALSITPEPKTEAASQVKQTAATLNGAVSAAAGPPASCEFQYVSEAGFQSHGFQGAPSAPCVPAGPFTGTTQNAVKAEVAGLGPETTYRFRLVASNENGPAFGEVLSFTTVGKPKIDATAVAAVTPNSATLEGLVNPNGGPGAAVETSYFFEYATSAGYANAIQVPLGGKAIGSGTKDVKVEQQISGLAPGATYHFRIVAENEAGKETGPDKTFTTYVEAAGGLPDGRAYEQVTPVDKNGGEPKGNPGIVQASLAGDGIAYLAHSGIPGSEGSQDDPVYLSSRGTDWSTQGLLPPASGGAIAHVMGWSADLRRAYVSQALLPGVSTPASMLERDNSSRALRMIAQGAETAESFRYAGASVGGGIVAFESDTVLSPPGGAANAPNVYVWDKASGEVLLAGIFNNRRKPAGGSLAGSNQLNSNREHYLQDEHTLAEDGSALYFREAGTGQLYLRRNPAREQSFLQAGECSEPELACTLQISASQRTVAPLQDEKPATFWAATPDGSHAFFTSPAKLTDDATTGPGDEGNDLYRYDAETGALTDLTPDAVDAKGAEVRGVLGASDDGSKAYFVANGVLANGATPGDCTQANGAGFGHGECNLYLSDAGVVRFLARVRETALGYGTSDSANWVTEQVSGGNRVENTSRLSPDGQTLLFRSQEQLSDYDNEGAPELYRYDAASEAIDCVSCNPTGAAPVGAAQLRSIGLFRGGGGAKTLTRNLSADGRRIFFETADKLVAADTNGDGGCPQALSQSGGVLNCQDVYEWEAKGAGSCGSEAQDGGCLYLISTGTGKEPAFFADADLQGNNAFFYTSQQLVGQDQDQIADIYDARIGGGIAAQNPPAPKPPCEGEACKGAASLAPATQSAGSASFAGPPNPKPKPSRHHKKHRNRHKRKHKKAKQHRKHHAPRRQG
jgi:DNA-binding beta-propeller fold protein YncE